MEEREETLLELDSSDEGQEGTLDTTEKTRLFTRPVLLRREENRQLAALASTGDERALAKLIKHNMGLVRKIASRYTWSGLSFDDLVQEGCIGLMMAARRFDLEREGAFSTYAVWWIRAGINQYVMDYSNLIRVPVYMHERISKILTAQKELMSSGLNPTNEAVATKLGITLEQVVHGLESMRQRYSITSLQENVSQNDGSDERTLEEVVADRKLPRPDLVLETKQEIVKVVTKLVALLQFAKRTCRARDYSIFCLRFGFTPEGRDWTLEQIGEHFGITRERVRQIEVKTLKRITNSPGLQECTFEKIHSLRSALTDLQELLPGELLGGDLSTLVEYLVTVENDTILQISAARVRMIRETVRFAATDEEFHLFCIRYGLGEERVMKKWSEVKVAAGLHYATAQKILGKMWARLSPYRKHVNEERLLYALRILRQFELRAQTTIPL